MRFIRKLFGRARTLDSHQEPIYLDIRSDAERQIELRAQSPLGEADERTAEKLLTLTYLENTLQYDTPEWKKNREELRAIGHALYEQGGSDKMLLLAYRAVRLGVSKSDLQYAWHGIGGWMR